MATVARGSPALRRRPAAATIGLVALGALALELLLLRLLMPLDALVWQTVLTLRSCGTDRAVDTAVTLASNAMILELAAAAVIALAARGARTAWPPLAIAAVSLLASKVLKNVFVRERPSMLPGVALGHAFPSGHVMNTVVAALAVTMLTADFRHRRRWRLLAAALVVIVAAGRLVLARHWTTDVVGGALAAVVVAGLAAGSFARRPLVAPAVVAVGLIASLALVVGDRTLAVSLPSPLSAADASSGEFRVAFPADARFWRSESMAMAGDDAGGPGATLVWVDGSATLDVPVPGARTAAGDARGGAATLALAGRPDITPRCCVVVDLDLNGYALPPFVAYVGWREYRFTVPLPASQLGSNTLRIRVHDELGTPRRFATAYVRLTPM